jgi:O-methyltransferase
MTPKQPDFFDDQAIKSLVAAVRPFSMVNEDSLLVLAEQVATTLRSVVPGHFVECGVWRGGASFLMAGLLRLGGSRDRKVWLFDSYEGLPPPDTLNGERARTWAHDTTGKTYFDNCSASLDEVQRAARELGLEEYTEFVKGWFDQTLPIAREHLGQIAILRIDGDWYASVHCCLENSV